MAAKSLSRLKSLLAPPVMRGDTEDALRAQRFTGIGVGILVTVVFWATAFFLAGPPLSHRVAVGVPYLALVAVTLALNRAGRVRLAGALLVGGAWVAMTSIGWIYGGVRETSFGWYLLVVLIAALLLGRGAAVVMVVLSVAAALAMMWAQARGLIPRLEESMVAAAISHASILGLSLTVLYAATHAISEALMQSRHELAERLEATAALEESQKTQKALLDATTEAAFLMDADGTLLAANETIARLLKRPQREMLGAPLWPMIPEDLARERRARIDEVFRTGAPCRFHDRGASGRWFDNSVYPVADEAGHVTRVAVFARDVTEIREAQAALQRHAEELERAYAKLAKLDRAKADFITVTAHELRTPLTLVMGYADLLDQAMRPRGADGANTLVDGIRSGAQRLCLILEDMFDMVMLGRGTTGARRVEVTFGEVVARVLDELRPSLTGRELRMAVDLPDLPPVTGDAPALAKALHHLVMNAIKFTPDGGAITIRGRTTAVDGQAAAVELTVEDTGIGIDPKDQDQIFESFHHVGDLRHHSSSRSRFKGGGLGLGLPLARKIAEAHGGRLWVRSTGHDENAYPGSTFGLVLPLPSAAPRA